MGQATTDQPRKLLRMVGIGKNFSGVQVLQGVDFDLNPGEVHILAGENGAGKSTLIKILAGVHSEFEGAIYVEGRQVHYQSPQEAARAGISVIHQELSLIPGMSVMDNIFLGRERTKPLSWMDYGAQREHVKDLLRHLDVQVDLNRPVEDYPLSVQQMIEISKALAFDGRILIMDEPTSALTDVEVEKLFGIIADLKKKGYGIIYISHKMEEIYRVADRLTVLRDGEYIGTETAERLPEKKLVHWMVGRELSEQFPRHEPHPGEMVLEVEDFSLPDPGGAPRMAVDGVGFSVRAGEIVGLAGLEGSGNSHFLNGLFGVYGNLAEGKVRLKGEDLALGSPRRSIGRGLALLTNDRKGNGLVLGMGVTQNTTLASLEQFSPGGWLQPRKERAAAAEHAQTLSLKAASLEQPVNTLSGGNQQKVVIAKWLQTQPSVLLLDDPTRGVDIGAKHEIYELMNALTARGLAIVLVSSEMPELLAMCDRILVMHQGRMTATFNQSEADQEKILHAAMGDSH